jgi:hypothetical protein
MDSEHLRILKPLQPHELSARVRALALSLGVFLVGMSAGDAQFRERTLALTQYMGNQVIAVVDATTVRVQTSLIANALIR